VIEPADLASFELRAKVKGELRKRMRSLRAALSSSMVAERSARIVAAVVATPEWASARTVALFWPMIERHEVDVRPLAALARAAGKNVFYPRVSDDDGSMVLARVDDDAMLVAGSLGAMGAPESAAVATSGDVDLVLVPALAIDLGGHRLGYGRGYYDRLLPSFVPPGRAIAVAFDFQLLAEIPTTPGDVPVDFVVTDARTFVPGDASTIETRTVAPSSAEDGVRTIARPR
jgi:5-formyltetrahydrofolate cyclo-ligase